MMCAHFREVYYEFLSWPLKHVHCFGFDSLCSTCDYGLTWDADAILNYALLNISVNYTSLIARA